MFPHRRCAFDVVSVDHDGSNWHPRLLANLHRVESFHERGDTPALKSLDGLDHEFAAANDGLVLGNQIKPGGELCRRP
jgi:hypothetical protein